MQPSMLVCFAASLVLVPRPGLAQVRSDAVPALLLASVSLNPASVTGGAIASGTVTLTRAAGAGGVTVKFHSSNPAIAAVPQSVVVQPGSTTATFVVQTSPIATNPNVVGTPPSTDISAQIGSATPKSAKLIVLPPTLASLTLNPVSVPGGSAAAGEVRITGPAPAAGLTVALSAKPTGAEPAVRNATLSIGRQGSVVSVPAQVVVPAGATTAGFTVTTRGVVESTPVQVTAANGAFNTKTASLTLTPPVLASFTVNPDAPIGGNSSTGTVTLTAPAPAGGVTFSISVSGSSCGPVPTLPASIQVPGGSASASFTIATYPGGGFHTVRVGNRPDTLHVRVPILGSNALVLPATVKGGTTVQAKLQMDGAAGPPNCGNTRTLESSNPLYAQVPASVTLIPGSNVVDFQITTSAVATAQTVTITVFGNVGYGGASRQATMTITP